MPDRLTEARALADVATDAPAGSVVELAPDGLRIACANGTVLAVRALQPEGRRAMSASEAVHGRQIGPGDRLERPPA